MILDILHVDKKMLLAFLLNACCHHLLSYSTHASSSHPVIAKRMQTTLPKVINPNQSAYVKGYYIGKNNRLIQDVIFLTKCFNMPGTVIFLDCQKALDTVNWNYPLYLLRLFNFGPDIQISVEVTYHNKLYPALS